MEIQESNSNGNAIRFRTSHCEIESTYKFEWEIDRTSYLKMPLYSTMKTSEFYPVPDRQFIAKFELCDSKSWYLHFCLESGPDIMIMHNVSVSKSKKSPIPTINLAGKEHFYDCNRNRSCSFKFSKSEIDQLVKDSDDHWFVLKCTMNIILVQTKEIPQSIDMNKLSIPTDNLDNNLSILTDNLKAMFSESRHTDITLHVKDEYISAHKSLLSVRSPVFDKLLNKQVDDLTISDIEMPVLKDMLQFLYTGTLDNEDFESLFELYHAAYQYEVDSLQLTCIHQLLAKLDVTNACRVLVLADDHLNEKFKASVVDFIQLHYDEIKGTDIFRQFVKQHPCLAVEVMEGRIEMCMKD